MRAWLSVMIILIVLVVASYQLFKHAPIYRAAASATTVTIDHKTFTVEVASTVPAQTKGLSGREDLAVNAGMLFTFSPPTNPSFWMIDMNFPLDMVWISNGKVVDITRNAPVPAKSTSPEQLPLYSANTNVNDVLEINAGQAASFKDGDPVKILTTQSM